MTGFDTNSNFQRVAKIKGSEIFSKGWRKLKGRKLKGAKIKGRRNLGGLRYATHQQIFQDCMQKAVGFFSTFDDWPVGFFVKSTRLSPTAYAYFDHCDAVIADSYGPNFTV